MLMKFNVPINRADAIVLIILAILMVVGVRIVIGFFKTPKHRDTQDRADEARERRDGQTS